MSLKVWLQGLAAAAIGASASSITAIIVDPTKFSFAPDGFLALGKISLVAAIVAVAGYLAKSPLPDDTTVTPSSSAQKLGALALCAIVLMGTIGCTSAQVATVVKDIATYAQEAQPIITEAIALIGAFSAADGSTSSPSLQSTGSQIKTDLAALVSLCNTYTANPSTTTWQQIISAVDKLVTEGDSAVTTLAGIKSSSSQQSAMVVLASLDALLHTIDGFVQTTQNSTQVKTTAARRVMKIQVISQYWSDRDKQQIAHAFGHDYSTLYNHEVAQGF
jgi:hypothetical protein